MILEKNLDRPILQIDTGKFSSACEVTLAILHSRKLVVAHIVQVQLQKDDFFAYRVLHEHSFDRNAFNFVTGNFGKNAKTVICVQSVDGALFFYEHEAMLF